MTRISHPFIDETAQGHTTPGPADRVVGSGATYHDLDDLGSGWSERDEAGFLEAIAPLAQVDEALWR